MGSPAQLAEVELRAGRLELASVHASTRTRSWSRRGGSMCWAMWYPSDRRSRLRPAKSRKRGRAPPRRFRYAIEPAIAERDQSALCIGVSRAVAGERRGDPRLLAPTVQMIKRMDMREPSLPVRARRGRSARRAWRAPRRRTAHGPVDEQGKALNRPVALATAARCRGLISGARGDLAGAETISRGHWPSTLVPRSPSRSRGRSGGGARRRMRQKKGARELLNQAFATFNDLGAALWTEKAEKELARIGGRPQARPGSPRPRRRSRSSLAKGGPTARSQRPYS